MNAFERAVMTKMLGQLKGEIEKGVTFANMA